MSQPFQKYLGKDSIEDTWIPATAKQQNYIEDLRNDLGMSLTQRNAHIKSIIGKGAFMNLMETLALSKSEASQIIEKFKEWKDQKR